MATQVIYTGNGATTQFDLTFPYTEQSEVQALIDRVPTTFTWVNANRIQFLVAPAADAVVLLRRVTDIATPVVDFEDDAVVTAAQLDGSQRQVLNRLQEVSDGVNEIETTFLDKVEAKAVQAAGEAVAAQAAPIADQVAIATTQAGIAATQAEIAAAQAGIANAARTSANQARDQILSAQAQGIPGQYGTYAEMNAAKAGIATDTLVQVRVDEKAANHRTLYRKLADGTMRFEFDYQSQEIGLRKSSQRSRTRCALIFDDGYDSNITVAAPILAKYGFAATIAIEASRAGYYYNSSPYHRVIDGADMRTWIGLGGEIANHPFLDVNASEQVMVETARLENQLIRDLLTGARVPLPGAPTAVGYTGLANDLSNFPTAPASYPEFADYELRGAVYQGGLRNDRSDLAYRAVPYRYIRSISGSEASAGKVQNNAGDEGRFGIHWSPSRVIDTNGSADALRDVLNYLRGLAETGQDGLMYGHHTPNITAASGPPPGAFQPPWVPVDHLETICKMADALGVQIVPMSALGSGNIIEDPAFIGGTSMLFAGATSGYDSTVRLNGSPRSVRVTGNTYSGNITTNAAIFSGIRVRPWTWYRLRMRIKIDTDLVLNGGPGNTNHGLSILASTTRSDAPATADGSVDDYVINRWNNGAYARRYLNTGGQWVEIDQEVFSLSGDILNIFAGLLNATGTYYIGAVTLERMDSLHRRPLRGVAAFNTSIARSVTVPSPSNGDGLWDFDFDVEPDAYVHGTYANSLTVTYAATDPSDVPAPTTGQTTYVVGRGTGAFANRTGQIGTWNGSAYTWATVADMSIIKAGNSHGVLNQFYMHITGGSANFVLPLYSTGVWSDAAMVTKSGGVRNVYSRSGRRSDNFTWEARPRLLRSIP